MSSNWDPDRSETYSGQSFGEKAGSTPPRTTDASDIEGESQPTAIGDVDDHVYPSGLAPFFILSGLVLVFFLVMLDGSIVATAIPRITTEFESLLDISWYGSAYQLVSAAFQPLSAKIYINFRSKWVFLTFFLIFELGSLLCGAATSSKFLIVGRAVAGLGTAGLMNGCMTIFAATIPQGRQAALSGVLIAVGQLGVASGPLVGGALTENVSWRWCFYINLPVGVLVALLLLTTEIPDRGTKPPISQLRRTIASMDPIGFAIFAPMATMFFLALEYGGNQYAWDSGHVIGLFVGAAATLVMFLLWEWRQGDNAMLPYKMLARPLLWAGCVTGFMTLGSVMVQAFYMPIYFQAVKGASPIDSGVDILPSILSQVLCGIAAGVAVQNTGYFRPFVVGGTALGAIAFGLFTLLRPDTAPGPWIGYQILFGAGLGASYSMPFIAVQHLTRPAEIPIAAGVLIFGQYLGGATLLTVAQTIFSNTLRAAVRAYAPGVSPDEVVAAGATGFRAVIPDPAALVGVVSAYSEAFEKTMYLGIGTSVAAVAFGFTMGNERIVKDKEPDSEGVMEA